MRNLTCRRNRSIFLALGARSGTDDKGKPIVRWGRKVTGLSELAGLPNRVPRAVLPMVCPVLQGWGRGAPWELDGTAHLIDGPLVNRRPSYLRLL